MAPGGLEEVKHVLNRSIQSMQDLHIATRSPDARIRWTKNHNTGCTRRRSQVRNTRIVSKEDLAGGKDANQLPYRRTSEDGIFTPGHDNARLKEFILCRAQNPGYAAATLYQGIPYGPEPFQGPSLVDPSGSWMNANIELFRSDRQSTGQ
jgi:hypothetical protein